MRFSLPARIFVVHLLFVLALGAFGAFLVQKAFDRYRGEWEQEVATLPTEQLLSPLAGEVARSLLLKIERGIPEAQARDRVSVAQSLNNVLPALPDIRQLVILDEEGAVQYANDPSRLPLFAVDPYIGQIPADGSLVRREVQAAPGTRLVENAFAVVDPQTGARLGAVLIQYPPSVAPPEGEDPYRGWATEIARAMLLRGGTEAQAALQRSVSEGLNTLIPNLPLEALIVVDNQRRIQYVNDPQYLDMRYMNFDQSAMLESSLPTRREVTLADGQPGTEVVLPVLERAVEGERRRLGSVLVRYRRVPGLTASIPELAAPTVEFADYLQPLLLFLAFAVGGGILLAGITFVPVRRMDRAFAAFRARGFTGSRDLEAQLPSGFERTAEAIRELGGRLEALDQQGSQREALLASLSQSLEDGMVALDPSGEPLAWNPAALRLLTGTDGIGSGDGIEVPEAERHRLRAALAGHPDLRFALERVELGEAREVELPGSDEDETRIARVTQVPVELRPGVQGTLLLIRDLAMLRRVEKHLLDAGRFAVLTHLAAGLAHEIRNPLHAIHINAGVVEQYTEEVRLERGGDAVRESVLAIKDEAKRLTELLNNYLGMVRPGSEIGLVDLRDTARKVIQLVNFAANRANVRIATSGDEALPAVQGDGRRLQQAMLNLVLNAIQAMPEGGRLTIDFRALPGAVRATVEDTGPGLPADLADRLFDTRVTTKPGGSGLGLPLVRMIVESHGGSVTYRPGRDGGACFEILLPAQAV